MATLGTLGNIVFSVSSTQVKTFDDMSWSSSAQYAQHNRHMRDVLLEFTGTNADTISFTMHFSAFLGVNPTAEIIKLLNAERSGEIMRLVIGKRAYGKHRWVITQTRKDLETFDNKGNLLIARVNVSLMAYSGR